MIFNNHQGPRGHEYDIKKSAFPRQNKEDITTVITEIYTFSWEHEYDIEQPSRSKRTRV